VAKTPRDTGLGMLAWWLASHWLLRNPFSTVAGRQHSVATSAAPGLRANSRAGDSRFPVRSSCASGTSPQRYTSGRCMDFESAGPADISTEIATEIGREVDYLPVAIDGAVRAAAMLANLQ
jgi:hypothetical protein